MTCHQEILHPKDERSLIINRCASLGFRKRELTEQVQILEKEAKRTPRKDMKVEWEKVEAARKLLPKVQSELKEVSAEHGELQTLLNDLNDLQSRMIWNQ